MADGETPIKASPSQGSLRPQQSATLSLAFTPCDAASYLATAICSISGIQRAITLRGISKYAFVVTDLSVIGFGDVLVGRSAERTLMVRNLSQVKSTVSIRRVESDCDPTFNFANSSAPISPGEALPFKVTYTAATSGLYSSDTYEVSTPGGNTVTVRYLFLFSLLFSIF
jgi:hypothetical protein